MPRGKYQRKVRMIDTTGSASDAAPTPVAEPATVSDPIVALLEKMSAAITALAERVDAVEQAPAGPRFIDPGIEANRQASERSRIALSAEPDGIPHSMTIPTFPNGEKVPAMVMKQYAPKFGSGMLVRLNLDAVPHGRTDGKTWGQLMAEAGVPNGYGEVFDRTFLSDTTGQWKYRVKFDKKVMPGSNGGMVALYEPELLSA